MIFKFNFLHEFHNLNDLRNTILQFTPNKMGESIKQGYEKNCIYTHRILYTITNNVVMCIILCLSVQFVLN